MVNTLAGLRENISRKIIYCNNTLCTIPDSSYFEAISVDDEEEFKAEC